MTTTSTAAPGSTSRRRFLSMSAVGAAGAAATLATATPASAAQYNRTANSVVNGQDLAGWSTIVGDGVWTAPGQAPPSDADIATSHHNSHSTLRANVSQRGIMVHNLTYKRVTDVTIIDAVHRCEYDFQMPYVPTPGRWPENAQTLEGGFFVWDGLETRRDYGIAFQWLLNPWIPEFGGIQVWNGSGWQIAGYLQPDTEWHTLSMTMDHRNGAAALMVDDVTLPLGLTATEKPADWGTDVSARLQAEIISLWPGNNPVAPSHKANFRNWKWSRYLYTQK